MKRSVVEVIFEGEKPFFIPKGSTKKIEGLRILLKDGEMGVTYNTKVCVGDEIEYEAKQNYFSNSIKINKIFKKTSSAKNYIPF